MRGRGTAVLSAAAMILMASAASAQAPNMTGKWTVDAEKTAASNPAPQGGGQGGARMGGGMGGGGTITIEAGKLVTERPGRDGAVMKMEYKLDGSDQEVGMGQGAAKAKAKIDGETIVIETTREMQGNAMTSKQVWSVEGEWLVSTSTRNGRDGTPVTMKTYYKKAG